MLDLREPLHIITLMSIGGQVMKKRGEPGVNVSGIITLLTDFGLNDPYVGIMKGVILSINPAAKIIDISHHVKPGSLYQASGILQETFPFFPKGTIHVVVIDPGVGSDRRPILLKTKKYFFLGPDNGVLWPTIKIHHQAEVIHLTETKYFLSKISDTFHGRDIFAPVAAHLSLGIDPRKIGSIIGDPMPLHLPKPEQKGDLLSGQVMRIDRFGNLITNIHRKDMEQFLGPDPPATKVGELIIKGLHNTYSEVKTGEILVLIGSSDYLEIAVNQGRACDCIGINPEDIIGTKVELNKR